MTFPSNDEGLIHPSAYSHAAALLPWTQAVARPHDALRYRCPETNSFVCITDDATLDALSIPGARLRCPACGKFHLLTLDGDATAAIGATRTGARCAPL